MSLLNKPDDYPEWATDHEATIDDPGSGILTPSGPKQQDGWVVEKPPFQYFNWLFFFIYKWVLYFESHMDSVEQEYDAIVAPGALGTHATLLAALADAVDGWKILVVSNQTINTSPLSVTKLVEIVLKPNASILKGTSTQGLLFTTGATGARIRGGKITGFSTAGDKAVVIGASIPRVKITEVDFQSNDTDIDDANGNTVVSGCSFSV